MLGEPVTEVERAGGGANNRVYRVRAGRNVYALKLYPATAGDNRDRLGAETAAISFMQNHGVQIVPALVGADVAPRIGLYEWIDGEAVGPAGDEDIAAALEGSSRHCIPCGYRRPQPNCRSRPRPVWQVPRSWRRSSTGSSGFNQVATEEPDLAAILADGIVPAFEDGQSPRGKPVRRRPVWISPRRIDPSRRTLSPSDFGFHNARRRADHSLIFFDFEYFGWDDPVKPVCDFVLHPGMTMSHGAAPAVRRQCNRNIWH